MKSETHVVTGFAMPSRWKAPDGVLQEALSLLDACVF
jgi:hypothetical protein